MIKDLFDSKGGLIAQVYHLDTIDKTSFPTPENVTFQFGVGVNAAEKIYKTHVHKPALRKIETTSEFLYVLEGKMVVDVYDEDHVIIETVELGSQCALLQFYGGHGIKTEENTKYFELKQGPYYGRDFDKYDLEV